jgi:glycine cleavage system aminomethyltransferase T
MSPASVAPAEARTAFHPGVRRSPYFPATESAGAAGYMVYNHMYMPAHYGRDPLEDYEAVTERVSLWDVGAERQTQLRGPDAFRLADYIATSDLSALEVGRCKYTYCCDDEGRVICDPVLLVPEPDVVWFSHGNVDLLLWVKALVLHATFDVEVSEPDVAPMQVQGPRSRDVLRKVVGPAIDELGYYRCMKREVGGTEVVISRTGWSGGLGYELFPLDAGRALDVWELVADAGAPEGLLVTGPNVARAMEWGITDTSYFTSLDVNALEMGRPHLVDLDKGPYVGRDALRRIAEEGPARTTVGLLGPAERLARIETVWKVLSPQRREVGELRWATYSPALGRAIAIAVLETPAAEPGASVIVVHPGGETTMTVTSLPFLKANREEGETSS